MVLQISNNNVCWSVVLDLTATSREVQNHGPTHKYGILADTSEMDKNGDNLQADISSPKNILKNHGQSSSSLIFEGRFSDHTC